MLAICCKFDNLDAFDLVWLDEQTLDENMILRRATKGDTHVESLLDRHADIVELNYDSIGRLAFHVAHQICSPNFRRRVIKSELKQILKKAIDDGRLDLDKVSEKLRRHLA